MIGNFFDWKQNYLLKINSNNEEASDATLLGPRSAVADLPVSEGTIVDDWSMSLDISCFKILVPLMGDMLACPVCEKREVHLFFMTLRDLDKHINLLHVDTPIQWGCINCGRIFPKLHGARCHILKCSDPTECSDGRFKCDACPMSFGTQRGL